MGRVEEAIEHDRRAVELDPGDAEAHGNLGIALAGQGRHAEAVAHYEAALAVAPGSAEVHNNLGSALARLGRVDEAVGHYAEAVRLRPGYGTAHYNLATAFYLKSRFEEAWREVRAARDRGYAPPQRFLDLLSAKMPEPRAGSANDAGGRRGE